MSAEAQFWNWFERHEDDLFHFERNQEPTFDRLAAALGEEDPLGEYDMETNAGFIEMMGHDSKYFDGAFPIQQLATDFDALLQSRKSK